MPGDKHVADQAFADAQVFALIVDPDGAQLAFDDVDGDDAFGDVLGRQHGAGEPAAPAVGFGDGVECFLQVRIASLLANPGRQHDLQFGFGEQAVADDPEGFDGDAQITLLQLRRGLRNGLRRRLGQLGLVAFLFA